MKRRVKYPRRLRRPALRFNQILAWADAQHQATGKWPTSQSAHVGAAYGESWKSINNALRYGWRGLPGGSSLLRFLWERRGVRNVRFPPRLTLEQILRWADAHHRRTGQWPKTSFGPVHNARSESWRGVDAAVKLGRRGFAGGSSLPKLLAQHCGVRNLGALPRVTISRILEWADEHYLRTGEWPQRDSGAVQTAPGETWKGIDTALRLGRRGLHGGSSLARLLAERRGRPNVQHLPRLSIQQILAWADIHHRRLGRWPTHTTGQVIGARGEKWKNIQNALYKGYRGLPGGSSVARLLAQHRGARNVQGLARLARRQILAWADAQYRRTGYWPNVRSGAVVGAVAETWYNLDQALRLGLRGLPGRSSLLRLLMAQGRARAGRRVSRF